MVLIQNSYSALLNGMRRLHNPQPQAQLWRRRQESPFCRSQGLLGPRAACSQGLLRAGSRRSLMGNWERDFLGVKRRSHPCPRWEQAPSSAPSARSLPPRFPKGRTRPARARLRIPLCVAGPFLQASGKEGFSRTLSYMGEICQPSTSELGEISEAVVIGARM